MDVVISDAHDASALAWGEQYVSLDGYEELEDERGEVITKQRMKSKLGPRKNLPFSTKSKRKLDDKIVRVYSEAAEHARQRGTMIINVGHGGIGTGSDEGAFLLDLAPNKRCRVTQDVLEMAPDPGPDKIAPPSLPEQVGRLKLGRTIGKGRCKQVRRSFKAFVAGDPTRQPPRGHFAGCALAFPLGKEEARVAKQVRQEARARRIYERIAREIRSHRPMVVILLTCHIGNDKNVIQRLADDWGTSVLAFKRKMTYVKEPGGFVRMWLEGDAEGLGTNIVESRYNPPITESMLRASEAPAWRDRSLDTFASDDLVVCSHRPIGLRERAFANLAWLIGG